MRLRALACLLTAVAAFGLPWQRCASECHERLLPAFGAHECHEDPCGAGHDHGAPDGDRERPTEHERIEFVSVPPATSPAPPAPAAAPVPPGAGAAPRAVVRSAPDARAAPPDGRPPTATVVLLS